MQKHDSWDPLNLSIIQYADCTLLTDNSSCPCLEDTRSNALLLLLQQDHHCCGGGQETPQVGRTSAAGQPIHHLPGIRRILLAPALPWEQLLAWVSEYAVHV